jgi:hypothetical protein
LIGVKKSFIKGITMIDLDISYDQLTPVVGDIRAGIVPYIPYDPKSEAIFRKAAPLYLGSEGAVHGVEYPPEHISAVLEKANTREIIVNFPVVALGVCLPVLGAGIMTEVMTYGMIVDKDNNLKIVPFLHAEDTSLDLVLAKQFRERTRNIYDPKGIGLGTFLVAERLKQLATDNPNWVLGGRENEYSGDNPSIIGLMNKFGASLGNEKDSPVLQLDGLMLHLESKWWVDVETLELPSDPFGLRYCPNNFATCWSSKDGKQQIIMIDTLKYSTFTAAPTVWTKFKSNGLTMDDNELGDILETMLVVSRDKMVGSDRLWGVSRNRLKSDCPIIPVTGSAEEIEAAVRSANAQGLLEKAFLGGGQGHLFGSEIPVRYMHMNKEEKIARVLRNRAKALSRSFGHESMLSGVTSSKDVPLSVFGHKLPDATVVEAINPVVESQKPIFDFETDAKDFLKQGFAPTRPFETGHYQNDNSSHSALRAA